MVNRRSLEQLLHVVIDLSSGLPTVFVFVMCSDVGFNVDFVAIASDDGIVDWLGSGFVG